MNWTKKFTLLSWLLLHVLSGLSQRGLVRYTRENGLTSNSIRDVVYDNEGFLWLASGKGIDRFDGQHVLHFNHEEIDSGTIASNDIRTIQCSQGGVIWATTLNKGLVGISTDHFQIRNFNQSNVRNFGSNNVKQVLLTNENMWLVFEDKLQFFIPDLKRINTYIIPQLEEDEDFVQLLTDNFNPKLLWFITDKRIIRFNYAAVKWDFVRLTEKNQIKPYDITKHPIRMKRVIRDSKGNFFISTEDGNMLYFDKFQDVYRVIENPFEDLRGTAITDMDWRDERYLYLCANHKEILLFDTRWKSFVRYDESERGALFPVRLKTHRNQIAIASEIGLFLHDESLIFGKKYRFGYRVISIREHGTGLLELIENAKGFYLKFPDETRKEVHHVFRPFQLVNPRGSQWLIVGENGIAEWKGDREQRFIPFPDYQEGKVKLVSYLAFNERIQFFGASDGSVYQYEHTKLTRIFKPKVSVSRLLVREEIYPAFVRVKDELIFAIGNEVHTYDLASKKSRKRFKLEDYITSLLSTEDGQLWVGTASEGIHVIRYEDGKMVRSINAYMGMQDDEVFSMVADQHNHVWVLNKRCVALLNTRNWSVQSLEPRNGMAEVTKIRVIGDRVYFLEQDGYVTANTNQVFPKIPEPRPYIMRVRDINTDQFVRSGDALTYEQNNLIFEFGVLDFSNGDNNLVSYRLSGLDNSWQPGNMKTEATYFHLPNGTYQFQVKVIEDGRIFIQTFDFKVKKPFWAMWWFILLVFVCGVFSVWLFLRTRIKRIRSTEQMRTEFNLKINELESKALRAQMNPHFLFNSLNSIRLFVLKNEIDSAADYIAKFSKLLRMILNHSRQDMITVYDEIQSLKLYLEFERLRFDHEFDFDLQIDGQEVLDCQIPPMIIQPFVENAIWHGLMPREDHKGLIRVSFLKQQSGLYVTVQDNGIGREKAKVNNRKRSLKEGSVGLEITKDRLKWLTMRTNRQNEFEIEDLIDEKGESIGTLVTLYFETPNKL